MKQPFKMITLSAAAAVLLSFAGQNMASAATFKDLNNIQGKDQIIALQHSGLLQGISAYLFAPLNVVSEAEGVQMIVKSLGLNLDAVRFVKEPKASDYFPNVRDNSWYAQSFIIAAVNGLDLPADLKPNSRLSRQEFTHYLVKAIEASGKLPTVKPVVVKFYDQSQVKTEYSASIQRALNYGIVKLDYFGRLNPKRDISRAEAAVEISNALRYLKAHQAPVVVNPTAITAEQAAQLIKQVVGPVAGLQIKIDPNAVVTRESFTTLLINTLQTSGQLPRLNLIPTPISDDANIDIVNSGAIQTALALGFAKLDPYGNFNPKAVISLADATDIANKAIAYLKSHQSPDAGTEFLSAQQAVELLKIAVGPKAALQIKIDPNAVVTRESFTTLLINVLQTSGQLPRLNLIPTTITDDANIDIVNSGAIQTAIALGFVKLDAAGNFNPKGGITRADATQIVDKAVEYLKAHPAPNSDAEFLSAEQVVQVIKDVVGPVAALQIKIDPNAIVTRESFTYLLVNTLQTSDQLPRLNLIPAEIGDNDQIDILKSGAIQTALALKIATLDAAGNFHPQDRITRGDATVMADAAKAALSRFTKPQ